MAETWVIFTLNSSHLVIEHKTDKAYLFSCKNQKTQFWIPKGYVSVRECSSHNIYYFRYPWSLELTDIVSGKLFDLVMYAKALGVDYYKSKPHSYWMMDTGNPKGPEGWGVDSCDGMYGYVDVNDTY